MTRGGGPAVQVDFLKLFTGWWKKAKADNDARYEAKLKRRKEDEA